jgi:hypothetical protein
MHAKGGEDRSGVEKDHHASRMILVAELTVVRAFMISCNKMAICSGDAPGSAGHSRVQHLSLAGCVRLVLLNLKPTG